MSLLGCGEKVVVGIDLMRVLQWTRCVWSCEEGVQGMIITRHEPCLQVIP